MLAFESFPFECKHSNGNEQKLIVVGKYIFYNFLLVLSYINIIQKNFKKIKLTLEKNFFIIVIVGKKRR